MKKIFFIVFILLMVIFLSCNRKCITASKICLQLRQLDNNINDTNTDALYSKLAEALTQNCETIKENKKFLIVKQTSIIDNRTIGLVYLEGNNQIYYFTFDIFGFKLDKGFNNFDNLYRVLSYIKSNFKENSIKLKKYYEKKVTFDAPYLSLYSINIDMVNVQQDNLVQFTFNHFELDELKNMAE